jgi:hypothetical protein
MPANSAASSGLSTIAGDAPADSSTLATKFEDTVLVRALIEALAMRSAPDVTNLIEHDADLVWPTTRVTTEVHNAAAGAVGFHQATDTVGLLAWLMKDQIIKKLDAEIDGEADDAASLSHEERQRREAEAMSDLLDIERQEAALVWRAMDEKLPVEHRADISPQAVLGVALVTAPRALDGPSSWQQAFDIVGPGR